MQRRLILLLSSLGLFVPACAGLGSHDDLGQNGSALDDDPDLIAYYASKEYAALDSRVSIEVRDMLSHASSGGAARASMLALLRSPKWLMLGSAYDPTSCPAYGTDAQISLIDWMKSNQTPIASETAQAADQRTASNVAALKRILSQQNVTYINGTLAAIKAGLSDTTPAYDKPASCGGDNHGGADGGVGPTKPPAADGGAGPQTTKAPTCTGVGTSKVCKDPGTTHSLLEGTSGPAGLALGDMFAQTEKLAPSRALLADWDSLRSRWQATAARAVSSQTARDLVRDARRLGSATIAREGARASLKFDQGAALVDQFVRQHVGFSADAMNVVHAVVADREHGRTRRAGQNVQAGKDTSQTYLPGSEVEGAVSSLFAGVRRGAANGVSAPQLAALFDQRLISIHPFHDANGRTTRLMADWLLMREGFPPVVADRDTPSSTLFWKKSALERDAHLARITQGMQRTVALLERSV
jgi:hypothetical protein